MKSSTCIYKNTFIIAVSVDLDISTENGLCDGPASSSSLPFPTSLFSLTAFAKAFLKGDFHIRFFCLCTGVNDTSTCCFSASVAVFIISVCHSGWSRCRAWCLTVRFRDLLSLLRALGSAEHGSVGLGQAPTPCSGLGPTGLSAGAAAHLFRGQNFYYFFRIIHLLGVKCKHCPRYWLIQSHALLHSKLSSFWANVWVMFLIKRLTLNKT